jgi:hypothetical protein
MILLMELDLDGSRLSIIDINSLRLTLPSEIIERARFGSVNT